MKHQDVKRAVGLALGLALWMSGVAAGCASAVRDAAAAQTLSIATIAVATGAREPDLELARGAIPAGLAQLATFAAHYPEQRGFRALHADALCGYALGFVFDDWDAATLADDAGRADEVERHLLPLLERCVAESVALVGEADDRAIAEHLTSRGRADAPWLLWIASARTVGVALSPLRHVAELPRIEAMLRRCAELAPGLRDAAAEQLLGTLAAGRARLLGGDDGGAAFDRARSLAPGALMVDVLYARGTLVARGDRAGFARVLRGVLDADVTRWPDRRTDNELARRKAARYLAAIDRLLPR